MSVKAAFLDRDGVINIDHAYVHKAEEFEFIDGVLEACADLVASGFKLVIVTNQSGIGRGYYTEDDFHHLTKWMKEVFEKAGAPVSAVYFCPHHPEKALDAYRCDCDCRKPHPGMLFQAQKELNIDMANSLMFGDKQGDMQAALAAGVPTRILVGKDGKKLPSAVPECTSVALNLRQAVTSFLETQA